MCVRGELVDDVLFALSDIQTHLLLVTLPRHRLRRLSFSRLPRLLLLIPLLLPVLWLF